MDAPLRWVDDLVGVLGPGGALGLACVGWLLTLVLRRRAEQLADAWIDETADALRAENDALRRETTHAWEMAAVLKRELVRVRKAAPAVAAAPELDDRALEYIDEGVQTWASRSGVQWIDGRPHDLDGVPLQTTAVTRAGRRSTADPVARMLSAAELPPDDDEGVDRPPPNVRQVFVSTAGVAQR